MKERGNLVNQLREVLVKLGNTVSIHLVPKEEVEHPQNEVVLGQTTRIDENGKVIVENITTQIKIDPEGFKE